MLVRFVAVGLLVLLTGCQTVGSSSPSAADQATRERLQARLDELAARSAQTQSATASGDSSTASAAPAMQEAQRLLRSGQDEDALVVLAGILRNDPGFVPAIRLTAATARRLGDWRLQNAALQQLVELEADSPLVLNECGNVMLQSAAQSDSADHVEETALGALRRAVALAPDNPRFAQDLFVALVERQRDVEAQAVLSQAIEHCPDDSQLPMVAARYFESQGRWDDAVRQYDLALQISPRNRLWRRERGMCHARLQNWDKASDDLRPALSGLPVQQQETAFLTWAQAAYEAGRYPDVIEVLDEVRDQGDHRTPETERLRVRALVKLRQFDAATDVALQAMIDWPQDAELRQLVTELEQQPRLSAAL